MVNVYIYGITAITSGILTRPWIHATIFFLQQQKLVHYAINT